MPYTEELAKNVSRLRTNALAENRATLLESEGKEILQSLGFSVPRGFVVSSEADLTLEIAALRSPYALKAASKNIIHKSDYGAVRLGLSSKQEVEDAMAQIKNSLRAHGLETEQFLLEEMAEPGVELVIGGILDAEFGPMIMIGLGGIFVEVYKDVVFRICPITKLEAQGMVDSLQGAQLLKGARGRVPVDLDRVVDCLLLLGGEGGLLMHPAMPFTEIDINPFIATSSGAIAVDARFVLNQARGAADGNR